MLESGRSKQLTKIDIFVSSPGDVGAERRAAVGVIARLNSIASLRDRFVLKPLIYEEEVPPVVGDPPQRIVDRYMMEASRADIFVCMLWTRMGTPVVDARIGREFRSGTEYEFVTAYEQQGRTGRPLMLLYRCTRPAPEKADTSQMPDVGAFFQQFEGKNAAFAGLYRPFSSLEELDKKLFFDLDTILAEHFVHVAAPPSVHVDFYRHVSLPPHFVPRPEVLGTVREALFGVGSTPVPGARSTPVALHGMGGLGKSVIARALCDDPQVQAAFPGGILWITLGQSPDLPARLREWIGQLDEHVARPDASVDSLKETLARLLSHRACLLVVDDVWEMQHFDAFNVGGPACRTLLTLESGVARMVGADVVEMPRMDRGQARVLLDCWSGVGGTATASEVRDAIVKRLGYLPLAIRLAGAQLAFNEPAEWIADFRQLGDLDAAWDPNSAEESLALCFELSLRHLGKQKGALEHFIELGIFRRGEVVPDVAAVRLWRARGKLTPNRANALLRVLSERALVERRREPRPGFVLHNMIGMLIEEKLGDRRLEVHRALVQEYANDRTGDDWASAPDDGYLHAGLAYHLGELDDGAALTALFAEDRWLRARVEGADGAYAGVLADLDVAFDVVARKVPAEESALADCLELGLVRAGAHSRAAEQAPGLAARAVQLGELAASEAIRRAQRVSDAASRVSHACALLQIVLGDDERVHVEHLALEAAAGIPGDFDRARAIGQLAGVVSAGFVTELLPLIENLKDRDGNLVQSPFLEAVIPLLPRLTREDADVLVARAARLFAATELTHDIWAAYVRDLAPHLPAEKRGALLRAALNAALRLPQPAVCARRLALLAPLESAADRIALEGRTQFEDQPGAGALIAAAGLREPDASIVDNALTFAESLSAWQRGFALLALVPHVREEQLKRACGILQTIESDWLRLDPFVALARSLPIQELPRLREFVTTFDNDLARGRAIAALARTTSTPLLEELFARALEVDDETGRSESLAALAPALDAGQLARAMEAPPPASRNTAYYAALAVLLAPIPDPDRELLVARALASALAIGRELFQYSAISDLAPILRGANHAKALDAVLAMEDAWCRAAGLVPLIFASPESRLDELLDAVLALPERAPFFLQTPRRTAFIAIVPRLAGARLDRALKAALTFEPGCLHGRSPRADALAALAPSLRGAQRARALEAVAGLSASPFFDYVPRDFARAAFDNAGSEGQPVAAEPAHGIAHPVTGPSADDRRETTTRLRELKAADLERIFEFVVADAAAWPRRIPVARFASLASRAMDVRETWAWP